MRYSASKKEQLRYKSKAALLCNRNHRIGVNGYISFKYIEITLRVCLFKHETAVLNTAQYDVYTPCQITRAYADTEVNGVLAPRRAERIFMIFVITVKFYHYNFLVD